MGIWFGLASVVVLIVLSALMAAAETALVRVGRVRALALREERRKGAERLVQVTSEPARYLNAILLLTLVFQLVGTSIATYVAERAMGSLGVAVASGSMTFLLFVFAEVAPKTFTVQHADRVALKLGGLVYLLGKVLGPLSRALIGFTNWILPGRGLPLGPFVTEEEILTMAEVAAEEKAIEAEESRLIHSIFEFGDTVVREVMVPRPDVVAVEVNTPIEQVLDVVIGRGFSRIPVYERDMDNVVGVLYAKDLLRRLREGGKARVRDLLRPAFFVPDSKKVAQLLREMQNRKAHLAVVVDEYGDVAGIVTMEDLLEEIVGEIEDEYDRAEPQVEEIGEGSFRVAGRLSIGELNELLGAELPDAEWDTVAGLLFGLLGKVPEEGEWVEFQGLRFVAERVQGRRISKVLILPAAGSGVNERGAGEDHPGEGGGVGDGAGSARASGASGASGGKRSGGREGGRITAMERGGVRGSGGARAGGGRRSSQSR